MLDISIKVSGYEIRPSVLRDSKICLGLASNGKRVMETCFEQTHAMTFHATGLSPGSAYMLRVVLFDRSNAVAVSVRSFRVGSVDIGANDGAATTTTIKTALQVALARHETGDHRTAEAIYRQVRECRPSHAPSHANCVAWRTPESHKSVARSDPLPAVLPA